MRLDSRVIAASDEKRRVVGPVVGRGGGCGADGGGLAQPVMRSARMTPRGDRIIAVIIPWCEVLAASACRELGGALRWFGRIFLDGDLMRTTAVGWCVVGLMMLAWMGCTP